jgi:hypothetical protein
MHIPFSRNGDWIAELKRRIDTVKIIAKLLSLTPCSPAMHNVMLEQTVGISKPLKA